MVFPKEAYPFRRALPRGHRNRLRSNLGNPRRDSMLRANSDPSTRRIIRNAYPIHQSLVSGP